LRWETGGDSFTGGGRFVRKAAIVAVAAVSLSIGAGSASATVPGRNGAVAYTKSGAIELFVNGDARVLANGAHAAWSPDGTKLAFDGTPSANAPRGIWTMNADGSNQAQITATGPGDVYPAWSPDGAKIAFVRVPSGAGCSQIYTVAPDGGNLAALAPGPECVQVELDWSPDGTKLAYYAYDDAIDTHGLYVANADNTDPVKIRPDGRSPSWSPSGMWIASRIAGPNGLGAFVRTTPDGSHQESMGTHPGYEIDWSPDGTRHVINETTSRELQTFNDAGGDEQRFFVMGGFEHGSDPAWQPLPPAPVPPGYPRPKGAGPLAVSLVPAFDLCASPNTVHGSPLSFGSCSPPAQTSSYLTVGTPDANGQGAQSEGRARLTTIPGNPATVADEADVRLTVSLTDVRCRVGGIAACDAPLADYTGTLRLMFGLSITDKYNGGLGTESATGTFSPFLNPFPMIAVPCAATPDASIGATCALDTTADALLPGAITEGQRTTWQLGRLELWDAGEDGSPSSDDNTLFAVQGLFVP
jgi:hypothetical protein